MVSGIGVAADAVRGLRDQVARKQVLAAAGGRIDEALAGHDLRPRGHSIEARICAESPENGYVPASGVLQLQSGKKKKLLEIDEAQKTFLGDATVAIIDTGIDPTQPFLADSLVPGYDFVNEIAGIPTEDIQLEKSFTDDLDVDSLSMVEVVVAAEERFGVSIPDDEVKSLKTVGDAVSYIERSVA